MNHELISCHVCVDQVARAVSVEVGDREPTDFIGRLNDQVRRVERKRRDRRADTEAIVPLEQAERAYVRQSLARLGGDRKALARRLGISERTLYRKLAEASKSDS